MKRHYRLFILNFFIVSYAYGEPLDALPAASPVVNPRLRPDDMGSFFDPRGETVTYRRKKGRRRWVEKRYYGRLHHGIDVISATGDHQVFAIRGGTLVYRGHLTPGLGYTIILRHEDNYFILYGHLDRSVMKLRVGTKIVRGGHLGNMGASGNARASVYPYQVHIEVIRGSQFRFLGKKTLRHLRNKSLKTHGIKYTNPFSVQSVFAAVPHSKNVFIYCQDGEMHCTCPDEHGSFCHEFNKTIRCKR